MGGLARTFALLSASYGWTDEQIWALPLNRIRQAAAAAAEQAWVQDLGQRRLATAQLRSVCAYIAATVPVGAEQENPLLVMAGSLYLGDGTQNPHATEPDGSEQDTAGPARPGVTLKRDELPDAPDGVTVGRSGTDTGGTAVIREIPADKLNQLLGGAFGMLG